jgi:Spy/CpxP family protein refolding chaperone
MKSSKLILGLCAALVAASAFAQATVTVYSQNPVPGDSFTNTGPDQSGTGLRQPELGLQQHARRRQRRHPHQLPAQRQRLGLLQQPKQHWEGGYRVFCRPRERWRQLRTQSF